MIIFITAVRGAYREKSSILPWSLLPYDWDSESDGLRLNGQEFNQIVVSKGFAVVKRDDLILCSVYDQYMLRLLCIGRKYTVMFADCKRLFYES